MVLFADYTNIQIKATNEDILNEKINRVMQQVLIWFHVNGLLIDIKETIAMSFHTWQNEGDLKPQIMSKGTDIKYKYETTFLG